MGRVMARDRAAPGVPPRRVRNGDATVGATKRRGVELRFGDRLADLSVALGPALPAIRRPRQARSRTPRLSRRAAARRPRSAPAVRAPASSSSARPSGFREAIRASGSSRSQWTSTHPPKQSWGWPKWASSPALTIDPASPLRRAVEHVGAVGPVGEGGHSRLGSPPAAASGRLLSPGCSSTTKAPTSAAARWPRRDRQPGRPEVRGRAGGRDPVAVAPLPERGAHSGLR